MNNKALRILYIIPKLGCGGAEILLGNICEEFDNRGISIKLVCLSEPHESYVNFPNRLNFERITQFEVVEMTVKPHLFNQLNVSCSSYVELVNEFKPDIIHSHLFLAEVLAHSFQYKKAVYFSHGHDNMFQLEPIGYKTRVKRSWYDYLERHWLLRQYKKFNNHFIAISQDSFDFFKRSLPKFHHKNLTLLHNAIKYSNYRAQTRPINRSNKIIMTSTGNLVAKKNHKFLLEVALLLKAEKLNFEINILGFGPLMDELSREIIHLKLQNEVVLRGNVGNVSEYLANSDIYLHPATYEPFGLAIIEAMASGLPVISLNGYGNADIINDGINGYMVDPPDAKVFASKILFIIHTPDKYLEIAQNAIDFSKDYNIASYCDKLLMTYKNSILEKN
jgi:glycosyltransferase involved in cell wall biosynthesis